MMPTEASKFLQFELVPVDGLFHVTDMMTLIGTLVREQIGN
jgi:hypothetical protein